MRRGIGNIRGFDARLGGKDDFYQIKLDLPAVDDTTRLLATVSGARQGVSITADYHDPDRLRLTVVDPPEFEAQAPARYLRGNTLRVSGRSGNSCNLDISARFGIPPLIDALRGARQAANAFVLLRVPSRTRDRLDILPDTELPGDDDAFGESGAKLAANVWTHEDFADWETHS
jgi:hypothetical protein